MTNLEQYKQIIARLQAKKDLSRCDLCFVIDCTMSMASIIESVKICLKQILDEVCKTQASTKLRYAFVGYRDYSYPKEDQFGIQDFVSDVNVMYEFITNVKAKAAYQNDLAENVLGGLHEATKLDWLCPTRIIVHFGDAPGHGKDLHEQPKCDQYYSSGDPTGLSADSILKTIADLEIDYFFFRLNSSTDFMVQRFMRIMESSSDSFTVTVEDFAADVDNSHRTTKVLEKISEAVVQSTLRSALRVKNTRTVKNLINDLNSHPSIEAEFENVETVKGTLTSFKLPTRDHPDKTIIQLIEQKVDLKPFVAETEMKILKDHFAHGSERLAFLATETEWKSRVVAKKFINAFRNPKNEENACKNFIYTHTIAKALADLFNTDTSVTFGLEYVPLKLLKIERVDTETTKIKPEFYMVEPFIEGVYEKFNTNDGIVTNDGLSLTAQTFSHWTYEKTNRSLMVVDVQGVNYRMTDPAIHSENQIFGATDRGAEGFDDFLETHVCNGLCLQLGLPLINCEGLNLKELPTDATYDGIKGKIVFCTGHNCGNYFVTSEKSPNELFCDTCSIKEKIVTVRKCRVHECGGEFEVSQWYFLSKGLEPPKACYSHRGDEESRRKQLGRYSEIKPGNSVKTAQKKVVPHKKQPNAGTSKDGSSADPTTIRGRGRGTARGRVNHNTERKKGRVNDLPALPYEENATCAPLEEYVDRHPSHLQANTGQDYTTHSRKNQGHTSRNKNHGNERRAGEANNKNSNTTTGRSRPVSQATNHGTSSSPAPNNNSQYRLDVLSGRIIAEKVCSKILGDNGMRVPRNLNDRIDALEQANLISVSTYHNLDFLRECGNKASHAGNTTLITSEMVEQVREIAELFQEIYLN